MTSWVQYIRWPNEDPNGDSQCEGKRVQGVEIHLGSSKFTVESLRKFDDSVDVTNLSKPHDQLEKGYIQFD